MGWGDRWRKAKSSLQMRLLSAKCLSIAAYDDTPVRRDGVLKVFGIAAHDVPDSDDKGGLSDPYFTVSLLGLASHMVQYGVPQCVMVSSLLLYRERPKSQILTFLRAWSRGRERGPRRERAGAPA